MKYGCEICEIWKESAKKSQLDEMAEKVVRMQQHSLCKDEDGEHLQTVSGSQSGILTHYIANCKIHIWLLKRTGQACASVDYSLTFSSWLCCLCMISISKLVEDKSNYQHFQMFMFFCLHSEGHKGKDFSQTNKLHQVLQYPKAMSHPV